MKSIATRKRRGFTLIELLVVVLILSILMAVALPLYLSAVADSQRKVCRANMQTIANAVQASYVRTVAANYSTWASSGGTAVSTGTLPDLNAVPTCPSNGAYTILFGNTGTNTTFKISCNYGTGTAAHGTFQPGVDSQ